jgi:hypothetical protein
LGENLFSDSMRAAFSIIWLVSPWITLLFVVRLVCSAFSYRISKQMKEHPVVHWVWGFMAIPGLLIVCGVFPLESWPLLFIEQREQRERALARIQGVGGWEAVRRDCEKLSADHPDGFIWHPPNTNVLVYPTPQTDPRKYYFTNLDDGPLPAAVAALRPKNVQISPARNPKEIPSGDRTAVASIKIFGIHSTGGHSIPYYGVEVACGKGADSYLPDASLGGASGNRHLHFRKVADRVFEICR